MENTLASRISKAKVLRETRKMVAISIFYGSKVQGSRFRV
jgi:hypothetical protein